MTASESYELPEVITPEVIANLEADVEWWRIELPFATAYSKGAELAAVAGLGYAEDRLRVAREAME